MKNQLWIVVTLLAVVCGCKPTLSNSTSATTSATTPLKVTTFAGREISFDAFGGKAFVLVFMRDDCPVANRYAPELRAIRDDYAAKGVEFLLVYPDPSMGKDKINAHRDEYKLDIDAVHDPLHLLVDHAGATITPEAAVFDGNSELVYRGRIDDLYTDFGVERGTASKHELRETLRKLVANESVTFSTQPAVGCYISDLQ